MTNTPQAMLAGLDRALERSALDEAYQLALQLGAAGALPIVQLFSLTNALSAAAQGARALELFQLWLDHCGESPVAYAVMFNYGVSLSAQHNDGAAEDMYRRAILLHPRFVEAHMNLATLLERKGQSQEALALWNAATGLADPDVPAEREHHVQALNNLGRLLENTKNLPLAELILRKSLALDPQQPKVLTHVIHLRQKQCEWPVYQPIDGISQQTQLETTSALAMLSASDDPQTQLDAARRFVADKVIAPAAPMAPADGYRHHRIRIGYLSSDLCSHAVSILTAELYELHDRAHFEVYAFSWTREDGTPLRARVKAAMDHYIRIDHMSDEEAAACIRAHEIDLLIDLHGLTQGTRPDILSYRPAPVQLTYLGYPGSTALPCIDYVIADRFVLPPELTPYFSEQPLYLPDCFQINDRQRAIGPRPTRADVGLPDDVFVFCSFNNNFKFTEPVFRHWMNILRRVPDSVLWIVSDHQVVRDNLRAQAQAQGVAPERLYFAERAMPAAYLARYGVADLFLDTVPFNAGTTASDALWAGLPLLTCAGRTFCSRMAGSLLQAVGLPQLITHSLTEYEELAVQLARQPERIAAMKQHLRDTRDSCVLFDSPRFVRQLEQALRSVVKTPAAEAAPAPGAPRLRLPPLSPIGDPNRLVNFMVPTMRGLSDPARFHQLMDEARALCAPGTYLGDTLFTWGRNNSPFEDAAFVHAWESNTQNDAERGAAWRCYMLACSAYHCVQLEGDFVACGVQHGSAVKTIIDYFGQQHFDKRFWAYDSFGGQPGRYQEAQQRFAGYGGVQLVPGLLPQSLRGQAPQRIALLHIALGGAEAETAVLDALFERVVPGGMVILEDYESLGRQRQQKIACDAWFEQRRYRVFPLPTGQGMVHKR